MEAVENVLGNLVVVKRSGQRVEFNGPKIAVAIKHAFDHVYEDYDENKVNKVYKSVLDFITLEYENRKTINVEDIQDIIEKSLQKENFLDVYLSFNEYRLKRNASREVFSVKQQHKFVKAIEKIGLTVKNSEQDKPMELMFNFSKNISKEFANAYLIENKYVRAHEEGIFYIEDMDSYAIATSSSSHLNFEDFLHLNMNDFTLQLWMTISHLKEEQHGIQNISTIERLYGRVLIQEFQKIMFKYCKMILSFEGFSDFIEEKELKKQIDSWDNIDAYFAFIEKIKNHKLKEVFMFSYEKSIVEVKNQLKKSLYNLLTSLEKIHSSLGDPNSSISLSCGKTKEEKIVTEIYLDVLATLEPLKQVTTIYKVFGEDGHEKIDELLSKQKNIILLFPKEENEEIFPTGERIYENINNERKTSMGRVLITSSTINLARLGLQSNQNKEEFFESLSDTLELCKNQLLQRYDIIANKYKENYEYLFEQNYLFDAKKLESGQKIRKVMRHGAFSIHYVGLAECLCALLGKTELNTKDFELGKEILNFMNEKIKKFTIDHKLNFILCECTKIKIRKKLLALDKSVFGNLEILKKNKYCLLSEYLKNLDEEDFYSTAYKYEQEGQFIPTLYLAKNASIKRIHNEIENAKKKKIRVWKVQVGKDDC